MRTNSKVISIAQSAATPLPVASCQSNVVDAKIEIGEIIVGVSVINGESISEVILGCIVSENFL